MSLQSGVTYLLVGMAGFYLLRQLVRGVRGFLSRQGGGCATGCGKCAFGPLEKKSAPKARTLVPISEIKPMVDSRRGEGS